jgi:hypothetical protein
LKTRWAVISVSEAGSTFMSGSAEASVWPVVMSTSSQARAASTGAPPGCCAGAAGACAGADGAALADFLAACAGLKARAPVSVIVAMRNAACAMGCGVYFMIREARIIDTSGGGLQAAPLLIGCDGAGHDGPQSVSGSASAPAELRHAVCGGAPASLADGLDAVAHHPPGDFDADAVAQPGFEHSPIAAEFAFERAGELLAQPLQARAGVLRVIGPGLRRRVIGDAGQADQAVRLQCVDDRTDFAGTRERRQVGQTAMAVDQDQDAPFDGRQTVLAADQFSGAFGRLGENQPQIEPGRRGHAPTLPHRSRNRAQACRPPTASTMAAAGSTSERTSSRVMQRSIRAAMSSPLGGGVQRGAPAVPQHRQRFLAVLPGSGRRLRGHHAKHRHGAGHWQSAPHGQ